MRRPSRCYLSDRLNPGTKDTARTPKPRPGRIPTGCARSPEPQVWSFLDNLQEWKVDNVLEGHSDWVRDVAWAPNVGLPMCTVASCGQDGKVIVWTQSQAGAEWQSVLLHDFKVPVWSVSWSVTGNILAVSDGNQQVSNGARGSKTYKRASFC